MMNELTNYSIFNENTGEIIQYLTMEEIEYLKSNYTSAPKGNSKLNDRGEEFIPNNDLFKQFIKEELGGFYFNYYNKLESNQFTFRFLYLCTFENFKGYLELGNAKAEGRLCVKKDLFEILNLSSKDCYRSIEYLEENNLIHYDKQGYVKVNTDVCVKGEVKNKKEVVRMFDKAIKELYENSLPKEHKKLGLLIKLLPLVNYKTNVICKNPKEDIVELIEKYTMQELSEYLGYSRVDSMKRALMGLTVNNEKVIMQSKIGGKEFIVVNPRIYYKGNKLNEMQGIVNLFKLN